ncbi:hypothetical protein [Gorillibacterium sp. CAU 1737]|uniref:hypothetical protein n=1 Tax=Gorillibacterium sp. CAU 1737 TaxID=3140362 RepID=UPI0032612585
MKLTIHLLEDFDYRAGARTVPVVAAISSDTKEVITDKIDLREIMLYRDGQEVFGSFIVSTMSLPKGTLTITEHTPIYRLIDAADQDDSELLPGDYEVKVSLLVYLPHEDGSHSGKVLTATKPITIR